MGHELCVGAKLSGTVMRLRQFDGLHHRPPLTVRLYGKSGGLPSASDPAGTAPPASQLARSLADGAGDTSASQLMPMIGTATSEQGTLAEHPSVAFSVASNMSNSVLPVPSRPVTP